MKAAALVLVLIAGCDQGKQTAPAPARVVAVTAEVDKNAADAFCDVRFRGSDAPVFKLPDLVGATPTEAGLRWINLWATWCPPCIEELPLLKRAEAELARGGLTVSLVLLSVDTTDDVVRTFEKAHPEAKGSTRISDPAALSPFLTSVGLDRGATLPAHVFVDATGRVRCARTGAIGERDLATIRGLFSGT